VYQKQKQKRNNDFEMVFVMLSRIREFHSHGINITTTKHTQINGTLRIDTQKLCNIYTYNRFNIIKINTDIMHDSL